MLSRRSRPNETSISIDSDDANTKASQEKKIRAPPRTLKPGPNKSVKRKTQSPKKSLQKLVIDHCVLNKC